MLGKQGGDETDKNTRRNVIIIGGIVSKHRGGDWHKNNNTLRREAFKIFDRDRDGFIDMKELKRVTNMLGTMLTKDEVDEFMAEADKVRIDIKLVQG